MPTLNRFSKPWYLVVAIAAVAAGCGPAYVSIPTPNAQGTGQGPKFLPPGSTAGVPVTAGSDPSAYSQMIANNAPRFHPRGDPFALSSMEKSFEHSQQSERLFGQIGGFPTYVQPVETGPPPVQIEPQPYRRLAGVIVGDSVLAIIDMGNGAEPQLIWPGEHIPNSPWVVASIDQDRAVLRRSGNVLPKEVEVRLETSPAGVEVPPAEAPVNNQAPDANPSPFGNGAAPVPGGGGGDNGGGGGD